MLFDFFLFQCHIRSYFRDLSIEMSRKRLEEFLKIHHQDAFLWARQCAHYNEEYAKDILQVAYIKVLEGKAVFKNKSTFKTWLFSVIRFTAIDYLKGQKTFENIDGIHLVEEEREENMPAAHLRNVLNGIAPRQQQVLLLSFYHGMTLQEIAETLALHIGTVRTHYERGKTSLRQRLSE